MAYITSVETQSVIVGECLIPPIAGIEAWPSIDPQAIASFHNVGVHLGEGIQNQIGLYNGIGNWSQLGLANLIGFGADIGSHVDAQPAYSSSAIQMAFSSPSIIQTTALDSKKLTQNGVPVELNPSDIKLKTNIKPLKNSLDKVMDLRGVEYDRIDYGWHEIGMIAQEVEKVLPDLVKENSEGTKVLNYSHITAVLVEAIKEQQEQINSLKETVQELSTKLANCCQA